VPHGVSRRRSSPGRPRSAVETPGYAPVKRAVTLMAGEKTALTIDAQSGEPVGGASPALAVEPPPPQPPADRSSMRKWAYVAGGLGRRRDCGLRDLRIAGPLDVQRSAKCVQRALSGEQGGRDLFRQDDQTVANVSLAVGILGVATGATLFVLSLPKAASAPSAALVVSPGWIGVQGAL